MASDGCGSDLGGASWKLSSRTVHQALEALYSTTYSALQLCKMAEVSASMECNCGRARMRDRLGEDCEHGEVCPSREQALEMCSVVRPRLPGGASIRESYSRSQCRLRLLAIAHLGQHHASGCPARERPSGQVAHVPKYPAATRA